MENSTSPFFETDLVALTLETTYMYYDGPMVFSARDADNNLWLVNKVDEDDWITDEGKRGGRDDWLAVPMSAERIVQLEDNKLDMHDAVRHAEGGRGIWIEYFWPGGGVRGKETAKWVDLATLEDDLFVQPGIFLKD